MVNHHQKASEPRTPPESQPRIGLTGASLFYYTWFFSVNDPTADGTCCNRLHAAALPCGWLHPIRFKQAKRRRRWPNRVACAWHCGRG